MSRESWPEFRPSPSDVEVLERTARARPRERVEWDEPCPGLGLRLRGSGGRSWIVHRRVGGRVVKKTLGREAALSREAAREMAAALLVAAGKPLRRLGRALDALTATRPDESAAIRLLLLTGCRRGEILKLRWREVLDDRLEMEDAKAGPRTVPLWDAAATLLCERRPNLDAAWRAVRAAADLHETLRVHDLRHTFASQVVMRGETLHMAGRLLGHRRTQTTERHAHLEDAFLLAAADRVSERVARMLP